MTSSQSENEETGPEPIGDYAASVAEAVGGDAEVTEGTIKVTVPKGSWVEAHTIARDRFDLAFFSWLSAIDWDNEVAVGDPPSEEVEESIEVLTTLGDITEGRRVTLATRLDHESPAIPSLVEVFPGANWHEREAAEMFGIEFEGHPDLSHLYLPDGFQGNPLRKRFPLLSREVKPWPGEVDVEGMPETASTENPEG